MIILFLALRCFASHFDFIFDFFIYFSQPTKDIKCCWWDFLFLLSSLVFWLLCPSLFVQWVNKRSEKCAKFALFLTFGRKRASARAFRRIFSLWPEWGVNEGDASSTDTAIHSHIPTYEQVEVTALSIYYIQTTALSSAIKVARDKKRLTACNMNLTRNAHTHSSKTCIAYNTYICTYVYGFYLVKFKFNISLQQVRGEARRGEASRVEARFLGAFSCRGFFYFNFIFYRRFEFEKTSNQTVSVSKSWLINKNNKHKVLC